MERKMMGTSIISECFRWDGKHKAHDRDIHVMIREAHAKLARSEALPTPFPLLSTTGGPSCLITITTHLSLTN